VREKVLGILKARRFVFSIPPYVQESLIFTPERVIVARKSTRLPYFTAGAHTDISDILEDLLKTMDIESILRSDKHNFAIFNSEIRKVELKASHSDMDVWIDLNIITSEKKYKWHDLGIHQRKGTRLEDYEEMLRSAFGDKLFVRLATEMREPLDWDVPT